MKKVLASSQDNKSIYSSIPNSVRACLWSLPGISGRRAYTDVGPSYMDDEVDPDDLYNYMLERYLRTKRESPDYFRYIMGETKFLTEWMQDHPLTYGQLKYASSKAKREGSYKFGEDNDTRYMYGDETLKVHDKYKDIEF